MVVIVTSTNPESGTQLMDAIDHVLRPERNTSQSVLRVAVDCEGVDLSRIGSVELVSICFPTSNVFLIDFGVSPVTEQHVAVRASVKRLLESRTVVKVIHDCRKDSDALYHLHNIQLANVHDTSCFHHVISGHEERGLNDVLQYNSIFVNESRDSNIYRSNPSYWATRPLSCTMIKWASSDVDKLIPLSLKQISDTNETQLTAALHKSERYLSLCRDMKVDRNLHVDCPGLFIGSGGSNIRALRNRTGTQIYQENRSKSWYVYYPDNFALTLVKREMSCNGRSEYF